MDFSKYMLLLKLFNFNIHDDACKGLSVIEIFDRPRVIMGVLYQLI